MSSNKFREITLEEELRRAYQAEQLAELKRKYGILGFINIVRNVGLQETARFHAEAARELILDLYSTVRAKEILNLMPNDMPDDD